MTWTEWAVLLLIGERGFSIAYRFCVGALATYRNIDAGFHGEALRNPPSFPSLEDAGTEDGIYAYDVSSNSKRH